MLEDLESENLEYEMTKEFLMDLRKEFGEGNDETVKVAELKKLELGNKMIEEFVQDFRRAVRKSGY